MIQSCWMSWKGCAIAKSAAPTTAMAKQARMETAALKKTRWAWALGTFFGAGLMRPGPGTYGSIAAVLLWFGAIHAFHPSTLAQTIGTTIAAIAATLIGI